MLTQYLSSTQIYTDSIYKIQNLINSDSLNKCEKFKKRFNKDFLIKTICMKICIKSKNASSTI